MHSVLIKGVIRNGRVEVAEPINLPDGSEVTITGCAEGTLTGLADKAMPNNAQVKDEELAAADAALDECLVSLGRPLGTDNEQIDAELAREYGDDHARLYPPSETK